MVLKIKKVIARQILDSRGNPTVEVDITTDAGLSRAAVPSGASTGYYEALELRDNDLKNYLGKSVGKAVDNINKKISKRIIGMNCEAQEEIDLAMMDLDGTENKSRLGANSILAVSLAACRAGALSKNIPLYRHIASLSGNKNITLPIPSFNLINGGVHAGNDLDFQEYMLMPVGAKNFSHALQIGSEIYHHLKNILKAKYGLNSINVGDEGGFAPPMKRIEEPLELLTKAVSQAGYTTKVKFALDVAASEFYKNGNYILEGKKLSSEKLKEKYIKLIKRYPIISIEDPFDQEDFYSFAQLNSSTKNLQIVGDDLLVTNTKRIETALQQKSCNALLLKVNQIGSITEALGAAKLAANNDWNIMVSHRSGETEDSFIADLVVGLGAGQFKSGAPCRSERLAKYNQLLRIEEELGKNAKYSKFKIRC
ncbi:phosphopyruvate hydratase [Candidatus Woesearchaeota archaeon]|jgi:enolase|nr:phosphopyruvate hydratase [Candidatus Woesearchaeota archaeon]